MKRAAFLVLLGLLAFAACDDDDPVKPPVDTWTCEDLDPSAVFTWSVDPVLDTLVTLTIETNYPETPCSTEVASIRWSENPGNGVAFRIDGSTWTRLPNGRLQDKSVLTSDDWAMHGDTLYVRWGIHADFGPDDGCGEAYNTFLSCPINYDTLVVSDLLPTR